MELSCSPDVPVETKPRRAPQIGDGELMSVYDDNVRTMYDNFMLAVEKFGTGIRMIYSIVFNIRSC